MHIFCAIGHVILCQIALVQEYSVHGMVFWVVCWQRQPGIPHKTLVPDWLATQNCVTWSKIPILKIDKFWKCVCSEVIFVAGCGRENPPFWCCWFRNQQITKYLQTNINCIEWHHGLECYWRGTSANTGRKLWWNLGFGSQDWLEPPTASRAVAASTCTPTVSRSADL